MTKKKGNILVVGVGSIGKRHISNFENLFENIFICDSRQDRLKETCEKFSIKESFENYEVAIDKIKNLDVVCICTPPNSHLQIAKIAVKNSINLFIEKPLGMNVDGWQEISDECNKKHLLNYVAFCHRHIPYTKKLKDLLMSNTIGKIINSNMRWGSYLPDWHPYEDYRSFYMSKKDQGGGALMDESHGLDLMRYLFGEVDSVYAVVSNYSNLELTSDDCAFLTLKFKDKILSQINFDLVARYPRINLEIVGETGTILWDRIDNSISIFKVDDNKWNKSQFSKEDLMSMYPEQAKYFFNCLMGNSSALPDIKDAMKTQKIIDSSFLSQNTKSEIKIS